MGADFMRAMVGAARSDPTPPLSATGPARSEFSRQMDGYLRGMLNWEQLDALWRSVRSEPRGWYVSQAGEAVAASPLEAQALLTFVDEVDALLRREHEHDFCGIVFADDSERPAFIKIFDPGNVGSFCHSGGAQIPPRWVLSRSKPERIEDDAPAPGARKRWWSRLFGPGDG